MASSLIPGKVKNTGIDLLIAVGLFGGALIGIGYLNKKFNLVGKFVSGAGAIGQGIGAGVGTGLANIPAGLASGFLGGTQPSTGSTGQFGTTPEIAKQNLRDNLTFGGLLDPNSPNYIFKIPSASGELQQTAVSTYSDPNSLSTQINTDVGQTNNQRTTQRSPSTNPTQPGSNLTARTIKPAITSPVTGSSGGVINNDVSTVTLGTLIQNTQNAIAKPLNANLQNLIKNGSPIYSTTISTTTGGTRQVTGSRGLLERLSNNLGVR